MADWDSEGWNEKDWNQPGVLIKPFRCPHECFYLLAGEDEKNIRWGEWHKPKPILSQILCQEGFKFNLETGRLYVSNFIQIEIKFEKDEISTKSRLMEKLVQSKRGDEKEIDKCIESLNKEGVLIKPIQCPEKYLGDKEGDWYKPKSSLLRIMCEEEFKYTSENGRVQIGEILFEIKFKKVETTTRFELMKRIVKTAKGNINEMSFNQNTKFAFIDRIAELQGLDIAWINQKLVDRNQNKPLEQYYMDFLMMFCPFLPAFKYLDLSVVEQLKKGYLSREAFFGMSVNDKLSELGEVDLDDYVRKIARLFIKAPHVHSTKIDFPDFSFQYKSVHEKCPDLPNARTSDIIVYQDENNRDHCFTILELLKLFESKNPVNPRTKKKFMKSFVDSFLKKYGKLRNEKFEDIDGEEHYYDAKLYHAAHPKEVKLEKKKLDKAVAEKSFVTHFKKYFDSQRIKMIDSPAQQIDHLMKILADLRKDEDQKETSCLECGIDVAPGEAVVSLNVRSDIFTGADIRPIQTHFCSYDCMNQHEFLPLHVASEERDDDPTFEKIVESI
jgi:hypothetical protein